MSIYHERFRAEHMVLNQISQGRQLESLRMFARVEAWLGRDLHTITAEELPRWMGEQIDAGYDANTVRKWLNMLRPYLGWAWKNAQLIPDGEWLRLQTVKPPRGSSARGLPRPYKRTEIRTFWREIDETLKPLDRPDYYIRRFKRRTSPYSSLRPHMRNAQAKAIVGLALYAGLRRTEIFSLTLDLAHPSNEELLVYGKRVDHRDKTRTVPYPDGARRLMADWIALRRLLKPRHESPWLALIAPGKPQRPIGQRAFNGIVSNIGENGYELHRFRHTFATERLRAGMKIETLQRILGHASLTQTLVYTEIAKEDLRRAMEGSEDPFMSAIGQK